jgi:Ca-activated chloride channel family protein
MEVAGRVVEGLLEERAKARADYDLAVAEGRRASIAEEERPGVFTMRVGNLLPGERATVRLRMAGPLPYGDGEATYRFPLVVAPRYVPGTPLPGPWVGDGTVPDTDAVPDASRITPPVLLPGFPNPVRLSLEVEVDPAGLPLHGLTSSLHAVCERERDGRRLVRMQPGERANRDFVLRLALGDEAVATALATVPDTGDRADGGTLEGTFALTLLPPPASRPARPRDVVVVLDRSGSMAGWKMVAARRAAARMLDTLGDADRFAVLAFDNTVEEPPALDGERLVPATDRNRFRAVEFLAAVEARGGTEMAAPLRQGVERLTAAELPDRERVLVLVTDGQVGNEDQLLGLLGPRLGDVRVFTVGIDTAVNGAFLKRLAGLGGGACELVESEDRLDAVMERIHRRVGTPVLTDLVVESAGLAIEPDSLSPAAPPGAARRLPDLFAGAPLVVTGRWHGHAEGALTVRGREASGREWRAEVPASPGANRALAAVWARGRLRDLEDAYAASRGTDQDLERRIVATSLRFGVLCRFTAFVAVDSAVVNHGGRLRRVTQPVDAPQGWDLFAAAPTAALAAGPATGGILAAGAERPVARAAAGGPARRGVNPLLAKAIRAPHPGRGDRGREVEVPLDAYRRRAAALRSLLAAADPDGRAGLLAELRTRLAELVEDLRSVGASDADLRPLAELLDEVERAAAEPAVAAGRLASLWERAVATLGAFAGAAQMGPAPRTRGARRAADDLPAGQPAPAAPAGHGRAGEFWKRPPR